MNASDFKTPGFYHIGTFDDTIENNAPANNPGDYYAISLSWDFDYQILLLFTPRTKASTSIFYVGHFWASVWQGWGEISTQ